MILVALFPHETRHCSAVLVLSLYICLHVVFLPDIKLGVVIMWQISGNPSRYLTSDWPVSFTARKAVKCYFNWDILMHRA
jgi:hypothetical protein